MPVAIASTPFIIRPEANFRQTHPGLKHLSNQLAHLYARHQVVTEAQLQQVGGQLWAALGVADAFAAARQQAGSQILPLIIESNDPAVQMLPWETLYHPEHGFLGKAPGFTLSRHIPAHVSRQPDLAAGPLRVLLFTSLPDDVDAEKGRLDVEEEQAQVLEALTPWIGQGVVQLEAPDDGRVTTLQAYLRDFRPHVVFMSGHGQFVHPPYQEQPPFGIFLFEDEIGRGQPVAEDRVADLFMGSGVACVVLSACEAGMGSSEALSQGLAWRLSSAGISHVVGMRESVLDRAGTLFARAFCDAAARQAPIHAAVQAGRQAITTPLSGTDLVARHGEAASGLAEQSLGQWCLPLLLSQDHQRPLLSWNFTPQPPPTRLTSQTLDTVTLPPRFLGRRAELRELKSRLRAGHLRQLLITGPGGQGKTALAGRLAQDLERQGYEVLAYAARPENLWRVFFLGVLRLLNETNRGDYASMEPFLENETEKAVHLLGLCLRQSGGKVVLFLDNLESVQDKQTQALTDERLAAWITAAQGLAGQGLVLLLTSRWRLPVWPESNHWPLARASYGDFLRMAQEHLPVTMLQKRAWLYRVYTTLHGNGRGLTFFAGAIQGMAIQGMDGQAEEAFLARLAAAETQVQMDMALAEMVAHLPADALALLHRLPAYQTPVPVEGIMKLGLDLPQPEALLKRLLAVSLVEQTTHHEWQTNEYQLPSLVADWLAEQEAPPPTPAQLRVAAEYQLYLWRSERFSSLAQLLAAHAALRRAGMVAEADRLALDWIVGRLNNAGLYETLLDEWLPAICLSPDPGIKAEALGQTGKQHHHLGNYDTALRHLEQSLHIRQEIGDKSGMGTTLNNISQIYDARGDYDTALRYLEQSLHISQEIGDKSGMGTTLNNMATTAYARGDYDTALRYLEQSLHISQEIGDAAGLCATLFNMGHIHLQNEEPEAALKAWITVYRLASQIKLAQALQALEGLAGQLGLPGGLAGWAALAEGRD